MTTRNAVSQLLVWTLAVSAGRPCVVAQETAESIAPILKTYCFRCHGSRKKSAGLNFAALVRRTPLIRHAEEWTRVIAALERGAMPPEDKDQPSDAERETVLRELDRAIKHFDYSRVDDPGYEPARRLTHAEYNHTIRDLFGIDLRPADRFPKELAGETGFDNSANTLFLQAALMERYIAAAERVVELALPETNDSSPVSEASHTGLQRRSRDLIFIARPGEARGENDAAEKVLARFLLRAYRRPPSGGELARAMDLFHRGRRAGLDFEAAIKPVLQAVLLSPKFLMRIEAGQDTRAAYRVSDYELASRLSYFLWATMPDEELFELAAAKKLSDPQVLALQIRRMLNDARAETLGRIFAAQWLGYQHLGTRIRLDPIDNPWCTDSLMTAMRDETSLFFMSLLRDDRPISALVDADYTFLNEELAKTVYGMLDVAGSEMRRVKLENPVRGGVVTHPSVMAITSNYKTTSPIKRGIWVLDTVLGTPPPPPPGGVTELDEEIEENRRLTFREKLALHSANPTCRSCHRKFDPLGFSLENFDFFGKWRDEYPSRRRRRTAPKPIDARAEMPDGTSFTGPTGLKRYIVEKKYDQLVRQLTSKMLAYALGRQLEYYDEPAIRKIIGQLRERDGFQTLIRAIVTSYPFQYKKNPSPRETE